MPGGLSDPYWQVKSSASGRLAAHLARDHGRADGPRGGQLGSLGPHDAVALGAQVGGGLRVVIAGEAAHLQLQVHGHNSSGGAVDVDGRPTRQ